MAGAYRRKADRERGRAGKYTVWWIGADGRKHQAAGTTDKATSLEIARSNEAEARRVRDGLADPGDRRRREASLRRVADHVEDYRLGLLAKGGTAKHADHTAGVLLRLLEDASAHSVAGLIPERIQSALGRMKAAGKSARTCNHALQAVKGFARWLAHNGRIREVPPGLPTLGRYNEAADRRLVRRALTKGEIDRLLAAAEAGPDLEVRRGPRDKVRKAGSLAFLSGPERAAIYRLAMGTGFRLEEIRTLTPERFDLDGPEPAITVLATYSKNGKTAVQPITPELAAAFRPFLAGKPPGVPVLPMPAKGAGMLRFDLEAAGIPYKTADGVADFHSLRHSYVTHLIRSGVNPKIVQTLARHSTITLTLDRYTHVDKADVRSALEKSGGG